MMWAIYRGIRENAYNNYYLHFYINVNFKLFWGYEKTTTDYLYQKTFLSIDSFTAFTQTAIFKF